jgi:hypothetical protein
VLAGVEDRRAEVALRRLVLLAGSDEVGERLAVVDLVLRARLAARPDVAGAVEVVGVVEGLTGGALGVLVGATAGTNCADDGGTV